jgi:hypothetical protein
MKDKTILIQSENIEDAINNVFNKVTTRVSRRNIKALGKVNFLAKIDFSVDDELRIAKIHDIDLIEPLYSTKELYEDELNILFNSTRLTKKQRELLGLNFLSLEEAFFSYRKTRIQPLLQKYKWARENHEKGFTSLLSEY